MTRADDAVTADVIDARLRRLAELSAASTADPPLVDMSAEAVTARLQEAAEISALALELAHAGACAGLAPPP